MEEVVVKRPRGRPRTAPPKVKCFHWRVTMFDKSDNTMKQKMFYTVKQINEEWNLNLTNDKIRCLQTKTRIDLDMKRKQNSFLGRYGHINIERVHIPSA
jgi:hypothetical protein